MAIQIPILHPQQTLSLAVFLQLRALLRQISLAQQDEALFLSEAALSSRSRHGSLGESEISPFSIAVGRSWVILLTAIPNICKDSSSGPQVNKLQVSLIFDIAKAYQFIETLGQQWRPRSRLLQAVKKRLETLKLEASCQERAGSLQVFQELSDGLIALLSANDQAIAVTCQLQPEKEHLFHQVITQIRHSLELPEILKNAAEQGRNFLQVDDLSIYCVVRHGGVPSPPPITNPLQSSPSPSHDDPDYPTLINSQALAGEEAYVYTLQALDMTDPSINEALAACQVSSEHCGFANQCPGGTTLLGDVQDLNELPPCLRALFRSRCPRAVLATPITLREGLWGLLVAQDYDHPRCWPETDVNFLKRIAEHVAIAIHQAQLYTQLRLQAQTLERRVEERTQDLRDALLAAQSADRAKSEFLATMSHELRTPLACIIGMSSALLSWTTAPLTEKQREYLEIVHDSGEQLLELINDILELARLEAGKTVLNVSNFSITQLVKQVIEAFQGKADAKHIRLRTELMFGSEEATLAADRRQVRRILSNLLSNAIKFTPEGGEVTLRVWPEDRSVTFQVEDTGIGIAEEQQSLLFKKFQQLDMSYRRQYGGTGLGLALTKQLVELHQGRISVDSIVGSGSTFTVHLPAQPLPKNPGLVDSDAQPAALSHERRERVRGGCILLIEEDEAIAEQICDVLTAEDYQVVWMVAGETAVHQIDLLQPIVVILALSNQAEIDLQLIHQLRHFPLTSEFKILLLTQDNDPVYLQQCLLQGANSYLVKPFAIDILPQQLQNLIFANSDNLNSR
ncbi:ATP-binding protein [Trichothermofontia sp.]